METSTAVIGREEQEAVEPAAATASRVEGDALVPDAAAAELPVSSRIQQLSPQVINKIAAGEVIERPASVVKELLDNSVDALATRIEIDVAEGGLERIRIVDNGEGIHPDDLELAVASHATSKIQNADDLFQVRTMGFRGEALASIAEVSRFRLRSRPPGQLEGRELEVIGGERAPVRPCGCPEGTVVEVTQLFFNVPVRRKFLKSPATEFGHISEQFTRVALAHPRLHLVLRHNDRLVYELPANADVLGRVTTFFGHDFAQQLIPIESQQEGCRLWGYVAHPDCSKSTRKGQYLFLNGRWIQDRSLQHALGEAYRGLLMTGRYPVAFLFFEVPADEVDVNVHPTKIEVRFQDSSRLYRQLLGTIRKTFQGRDLAGTLQMTRDAVGTVTTPATSPPPVDPERQLQVQRELVEWVNQQAAIWADPNAVRPPLPELDTPRERRPFQTGDAAPADATDLATPSRSDGLGYYHGDAERVPSDSARQPTFGGARTAAAFTPGTAPFIPYPPLPGDGYAALARHMAPHTPAAPVSYTPPPPTGDGAGRATEDVGPSGAEAGDALQRLAGAASWQNLGSRALQVHDTYLVVETEEGVSIIDQHALHERILYEHLRTRVLGRSLESQRLLIPVPVELPAAEANVLLTQADLLAECGWQIADFGGTTLLVSAYPSLLRRVDPARLLRDVAEQLLQHGTNVSSRDLLDRLLHMMACKAAVKAGQRLQPEEIEALLAQQHLVDDPHHCPHGRPTALRLSRNELDRQFGRLGS